MSVKLLNSKTGVTAVCERADWTECRDHKSSLGWKLWTPEALNSGDLAGLGISSTNVNRDNPPHLIVIEEDENSGVYLDENGKLYRKQYDNYGGAGSTPMMKLGRGKQIKEAVKEAWARYDEEQRLKAERNKDNPYKEYGVEA